MERRRRLTPSSRPRPIFGFAVITATEVISDREVIQKAYEAGLMTMYAVFVSNFTTALGDKQKEAEVEADFQRAVVHARHVRERALALLK
jgi:hypothetical protein